MSEAQSGSLEGNKQELLNIVSNMQGQKSNSETPIKEGISIQSESLITDESPFGKMGWLDCTEEQKGVYLEKRAKGLSITPMKKSPGGTEYIRMRGLGSVKNLKIPLADKKKKIQMQRKRERLIQEKCRYRRKLKEERFGVQFEDTPEKLAEGELSVTETPVGTKPPPLPRVKEQKEKAKKKKKALKL